MKSIQVISQKKKNEGSRKDQNPHYDYENERIKWQENRFLS